MSELVGSAARYTVATAKTTARTSSIGRQRQAWDCYRAVPEVRSYANWVGNAMSRTILRAGRARSDGTIAAAPSSHPATEYVAAIAGGPDGRRQHLREYGRHLAVAGEGWTIVQPRDTALVWHVRSVLEVSNRGAGSLEAKIDGDSVLIPAAPPDGQPLDPQAPVAIRVWDPDPADHLQADSPMLGCLDILEELRLLSAAVRAVALSRLTGRGLLFIPKGARFPTKVGPEGAAEDDLIDVLMEVASTAIRDPESAAATVPILVELPAEAIAAIQHLKMDSDFDELLLKLRQEAIGRIAVGADIPAEILLGQGDVNHWTTWSLQEEAIKLGVEPRLDVVCNAYTTQWLRPLLEADRLPDAEEWVVWADTSPLRVRTNRAQTAIEVFQAGGINGRALRRETGFTEDDAPDAETAAHARRTPADDDQEQEDTPMPRTPLPVDETTNPPARPDTPPAAENTPDVTAAGMPGPSDALVAAVDGLLWHALSSAGEKLRRTPACPRDRRAEARSITAAIRHTVYPITREDVDNLHLLDGVLDRAPDIAARYGASADCLHATLHAYLRELMAAGVAYDPTHVRPVIAGCAGTGVLEAA
ncbi:hypothetical protein VSR01_17165 [Actinacidiphila sp. DG2A-62]|uniref:hypothetical protein n=1 Tax=Actinacidiphila sp. DG2A-62 TaxID=3108821 RepID=UPI002DB96FD2|nr:hypothetical protein [Actinacidiphila sp. DG2A-62]MEC3995169.1 hypothetical protein [Actinacidiphila sp. DG2A-62]